VVGHDWRGVGAGARPLPISLTRWSPHGACFDWRGDADVPLDKANSESVVGAPEQLVFVNASVGRDAVAIQVPTDRLKFKHHGVSQFRQRVLRQSLKR
jgi:hypothetical protein